MMTLEQIYSLPLEKRVGQLFFIGINGTELSGDTAKLVEDISPGGVCLFARNVRTQEQVRKLLDDLRGAIAIEPFLSLDQEGGLVDRLRRISTPMPAASDIQNEEQSVFLAETTAEIIRTLGFNMNFAPVIDVMDEDRAKYSNGLHSRAFGRSKQDVIDLAGIYLAKLQENGIIGTLKHFPGLGGAKIDAHVGLPSIDISFEELSAVDLFPYRELMKQENVYAIMVAHTCFPATELQQTDQSGKLLPTSLSSNFVTKLLRDDLGFEGLAITDDLEMGAIVNDYGIAEACKMAINAGEDLIAICANESAVREGFQAVLAAVESNEITEERINASLKRIYEVKLKLSQPLPFNSERLNELSKKIAELCKQVKYTYGG